ncbi:hypothetical protein CWO89_45290, partial [Bradyrhizobium sp. Leo170]
MTEAEVDFLRIDEKDRLAIRRRCKPQGIGRSAYYMSKDQTCSGVGGQITAPILMMPESRQVVRFLHVKQRGTLLKKKRGRAGRGAFLRRGDCGQPERDLSG